MNNSKKTIPAKWIILVVTLVVGITFILIGNQSEGLQKKSLSEIFSFLDFFGGTEDEPAEERNTIGSIDAVHYFESHGMMYNEVYFTPSSSNWYLIETCNAKVRSIDDKFSSGATFYDSTVHSGFDEGCSVYLNAEFEYKISLETSANFEVKISYGKSPSEAYAFDLDRDYSFYTDYASTSVIYFNVNEPGWYRVMLEDASFVSAMDTYRNTLEVEEAEVFGEWSSCKRLYFGRQGEYTIRVSTDGGSFVIRISSEDEHTIDELNCDYRFPGDPYDTDVVWFEPEIYGWYRIFVMNGLIKRIMNSSGDEVLYRSGDQYVSNEVTLPLSAGEKYTIQIEPYGEYVISVDDVTYQKSINPDISAEDINKDLFYEQFEYNVWSYRFSPEESGYYWIKINCATLEELVDENGHAMNYSAYDSDSDFWQHSYYVYLYGDMDYDITISGDSWFEMKIVR